ncbi:acid protease [Plenodomus tracheiphilus IPT5]|uniref:Acid protease n=1 Tax=Plenodomus tracheiphilus IPT5 TaxID=1408161 RepID=A0A6A7B2P2_9PLEO|nr:acid protease [Plenodomus tracheiphilus IPT5]
MRFPILTVYAFLSSSCHAFVNDRRAAAEMPATPNVMALQALPYAPHLIPPSSKHLLHRRHEANAHSKRQLGDVQETLLTLGGRVYMTSVTLAGQPFTLVIDTGSSDTWVAATSFSCLNSNNQLPAVPTTCGFNASYDPTTSRTWTSIPNFGFSVNYTGGEFLRGELGVEELGVGGVGAGGAPVLIVNQTIGVVEEGHWVGDGRSSGLMGLAYPALVSGASELHYNSSMFTLTAADTISSVFSLALSRPSLENPYGGGYLAIGGIPPVSYDLDYITTPTLPATATLYAWYSLSITGYNITLPRTASRRQKRPFRPDPLTSSSAYIIDSGSSLIYAPDAIADHIAASFVPPATFNRQVGMWIVKCNADAPRVGIIIEGRTFWVSEDDLMNRGVGAVGGEGMGAKTGQCVLGVQRAGEGSLVLGDVWLKNVLVVFDLKGARTRVAGREVY